jgi:hypothetical protein
MTRTSPLTGKVNVLDIPVTTEQLNKWEVEGALIQDAMPDLSPEHREFILSGLTPEDWNELFPDDEPSYSGVEAAF